MNIKFKYALFDFFLLLSLTIIFVTLNLLSINYALIFVFLTQLSLVTLNCYSYLIRFLDLTTATILFFKILTCTVLATIINFIISKQISWAFTFSTFFLLYSWRVLVFSMRNVHKTNKIIKYIIFGTEEPQRLMYFYLHQKLKGEFFFLDLSGKWVGNKLYGQKIINEAQLSRLGSQVKIVLLEDLNSVRKVYGNFVLSWENKFINFNSLIPKQTNTFTEIDMSKLLEQLTGREHDSSDDAAISESMKGKTVLVTGGAGSIGSELVRQLLKNNAHFIHVIDANEFGIYKLQEELSERHGNICFHLGDVRDKALLSDILSKGCDLVFHAAAYKHVPIVEQNHEAAYLNNYVGTKILLRKCIEFKIEHMILVSTDKAVRPTNIMGATKRLAELAIVSAHHEEKSNTKFSIVRFGNVMGSSGSVIPKFKDQILNGGPVTVTHPDIKRYFMTIPEAAKLVLKSQIYTKRKPCMYVLDMGQQLKIIDLVNVMMDLLSSEPVDVIFTGLRPGEKMYEELVHDGELSTTPDKKILVQDLDRLDIESVNVLLEKIDYLITKRDFSRLEDYLTNNLINFKKTSF